MNKRINLYYQGKEVSQESINLGELCHNDNIDLLMVSLSIAEPDVEAQLPGEKVNNNKLQEAIVNKMSVMCPFHPEIRQMNICLNCLISFCEQCMSNHKDHQVINKDTIVEFSTDLKEKSEKMKQTFKEIGVSSNINENDGVCKDLRNDINKQLDLLNEILVGIKKKYEMTDCEFKMELDSLLPFLLEFNETVDTLYDKSKNEATLRYDKDFIDFYKKCLWVKNQEEKITNDFQNLRKLIQRCTIQLGDIKNQIEEIVNFANDKYASFKSNQARDQFIPNFSPISNSPQDIEKDLIDNNSNFNIRIINEPINQSKEPINQSREPNDFNHKSVYSNQAGLSSSRLNLMTLLAAPKQKQALIRSIERKGKKNNRRRSSCTNNINGTLLDSQSQININLMQNKSLYKDNNDKAKMFRKEKNTFFNVCLGSLSILSYSSITKQLSKIALDQSQCPIKKFETYHSTINFQGGFYISGGYSTSHYFGTYDAQSNKLIALPNMIHSHAYHGIVGITNSIYIVSGLKTQKVERIELGEMKWESIAEVSSSRTYPSCVNIDEKFIYLFGGICDNIKDSTKAIEKYDVSKGGDWEMIEIVSEEEIPFYYGVIKVSNELLLLLGGKYDSKNEEGIDCFQLSINKKEIKKDEAIKLSKADEFNGKMFINLIDNNFGGFSSLYNDVFYLFNADTKIFEEFNLQNNTTNANSNNNAIAN